MARRPYAGTADAYVIDATGKPLPGRDDLGAVLVSGQAYTAQTGGSVITDLQNLDGSPITGGVIVPDQNGRIPRFLGPDGVATLWLDFGAGTFLLLATDLPDRVATLEAAGTGGGGSGGDQPPATAVVYSSTYRSSRPATNAALFTWTCDGTADQAEIQAAIDAVAAKGGGKVQLLGSTFNTSAAIKLRTAVWLCGEGPGTILRPSTDFQTGMVMLFDNTTHLTKLSDLTLYAQGAQVHGVHYIANGGEVFNTPAPDSNPDAANVVCDLFIRGCGDNTWAGDGMRLEGGNLRAGRYHSIRILACSGNGIWLKGGVDSFFSNIDIGSSGAGGPTPSSSSTAPVGHGFYVGAGDSCMISNVKCWYSRWSGFYSRATRLSYSNCQAQDNHGDGFTIAFGKVTLSSCHADSNGQAQDTTRGVSGFKVTADLVTMVGCSSYDRGGQAWVQQNGYQFTGGMSNSRVVGCISYSNALASVSGAPGTNTTVDVRADSAGK